MDSSVKLAPAAAESLPGRPREAAVIASFRYRDFRYFWVANFTTYLGGAMMSIAQGWLMYGLTNSPFMLGLVSFVGSVPFLLFTLIGGAAADRVEKRRLLILTQTVSLTSLTLLATLTATGLVRVWHVFVIAFVGGSSMAFKGPARTALVNDLVEPHHLLNAIALNSTGINITRMLGPALGGILLANLGIAATFYCGAVFLAIAMVNLIMLRVTSKPVMHRPSIWGQVVEGLRYVSQNEIVFTLIGLITIPTLFGMPYQTLLPVFARDVLQVGETGLGWLSACTGVGAVTGSLTLAFLGNYRKRGKMLLGCAIAFGAALICFSLSAGLLPSLFVLSLLLMTLVGFANMTYTTTTNTLLQTMSPPELRGRVMSLYMLSFGLTPLGALPVGAAAGRVGAPLAVGLSGAICLLFVLLVAVKRRKLWRIA